MTERHCPAFFAPCKGGALPTELFARYVVLSLASWCWLACCRVISLTLGSDRPAV